tara:strand:+ start:2258 stop:2539 length:282 start_codon:yes stop_codon:yes gene_type:complete
MSLNVKIRINMKLGMSRNQCGACGQYFNSNSSFGKHRTGDFGIDRRCLNVEEMEAKKMEKNAAGFWTNGLMDQSIIEKRNAIREQEKTIHQGI